jgi:hypothetical protein
MQQQKGRQQQHLQGAAAATRSSNRGCTSLYLMTS